MQKIIITLVTFFVAMQLGAATYTIVSQNNDTIRLYSNELGESLKSLIPKADLERKDKYRLIEKMMKVNAVLYLWNLLMYWTKCLFVMKQT